MGHIISQDDIPKCQMLQITAVERKKWDDEGCKCDGVRFSFI